LDLGIGVTLAQDATFTLLDIRRPPRSVEMMQRNQAFLDVGTGAHLLRAAKEDADLAGTHVAEELQLGGVTIVILDELNLRRWNAACQQLCPACLRKPKSYARRSARRGHRTRVVPTALLRRPALPPCLNEPSTG
jgi:hypothetical protein